MCDNIYDGEIKPCPFCGHQPRRDNLIDSLHPSGIKWFKSPMVDIQLYGKDLGCFHTNFDPKNIVLAKDMTERGQYYVFTCLETEGGCDAQVHGYSIDDVMKKWNNRV